MRGTAVVLIVEVPTLRPMRHVCIFQVTKGPEDTEPKRGRKRPVELLSSLTGKVFESAKAH